VILNLFVNAAHSIREKIKDGEKGRITVRTRTGGEFVEISVTDTGNGIPIAIQTKVFDPFFTTKEVGKGTGQGLALVYSVVVKNTGAKYGLRRRSAKVQPSSSPCRSSAPTLQRRIDARRPLFFDDEALVGQSRTRAACIPHLPKAKSADSR
jgi:hypothetical protein